MERKSPRRGQDIRQRSRSPRYLDDRETRSPHRERHRQSSRSRSPHDNGDEADTTSTTVKKKQEPNFKPSGLLAAESNSVNGVVLKYHEPAEARLSKQKWRLHVFKGQDQLDVLHIYKQSVFLFGRERKVVDVATEHPSCSKQHAVIQFRQVNAGDKAVVKPYLLDLESANGTLLNKIKIDSRRYYELKHGDVVAFGFSSREYVILNEDEVRK